jgi:tetratricopeptide (TPR) repeat protein
VSRIPRWSGTGNKVKLVLSRLDGSLEIADIAALTGMSEEAVEETLEPLIATGVVAFGDQSAAPTAETRRSSGEMPATSGGPPALAPLNEEERTRINDLFAKLNKIDHYRLLGVAATADVKEVKRAYYALAKLYHPDRFFRKDVGALRPKIDAIFAAMTTALDTLTDVERRSAYDGYLREGLKTRITRRNAESLETKKDWAAAAENWRRVVESLPTDADAQHRYAYSLLRAKTITSIAIDAATRAIELDPARAEYRVTAASLYLAEGRDRSALAELTVACELESDRMDLAALASAIAERLDRARA